MRAFRFSIGRQAAILLLLALPPGPAASAELINVNTATVAALESVPGVGRKRAEAMVRIRGRNGPFQSIEELRALPRLTKKQFEQIRRHLTVGEGNTAPEPREPAHASAPHPSPERQ
jgi:competence protein ComEA